MANKAIHRQYHSYFDWSSRNANSFFGLFGTDVKARWRMASSEDPDLKASMQSFLVLGEMRNRLVHGDFATFQLDSTLEEVYNLYVVAKSFVVRLPDYLHDAPEETSEQINT